MIAIGRLRKDNGEPNLDAVTRFVFHCASKSLSSYLGFYFDDHINWAAWYVNELLGTSHTLMSYHELCVKKYHEH